MLTGTNYYCYELLLLVYIIFFLSPTSLLFIDEVYGYRVASVKLIPKSVKCTIYFVMLPY